MLPGINVTSILYHLKLLWSSIAPNYSQESVSAFNSPTFVFSGCWQVKTSAYISYRQQEATSDTEYHEIF